MFNLVVMPYVIHSVPASLSNIWMYRTENSYNNQVFISIIDTIHSRLANVDGNFPPRPFETETSVSDNVQIAQFCKQLSKKVIKKTSDYMAGSWSVLLKN